MEQPDNRPTLATGEFYEFADRLNPLIPQEYERQELIFRELLKKIGRGSLEEGEKIVRGKCRKVLLYRTKPSVNEIARNTDRKIFSHVFCPPADEAYNYDAFMLYCRNSGQLSDEITAVYSQPASAPVITDSMPLPLTPPLQLPPVTFNDKRDTIPDDFPVLDLGGLSLPPQPPPVQPMPAYTPHPVPQIYPSTPKAPDLQIYSGNRFEKPVIAKKDKVPKKKQDSSRAAERSSRRVRTVAVPTAKLNKEPLRSTPRAISLSTRAKISLFGGALLFDVLVIGSALNREPQQAILRECWQQYEHGKLGVGCENESGHPYALSEFTADLGEEVRETLRRTGAATIAISIREKTTLKCTLVISKKKIAAGIRDRENAWPWPREEVKCVAKNLGCSHKPLPSG